MDGTMLFVDGLPVWVDQSGIVFSAETFPDSDEIEHVLNYHDGKYCPMSSPNHVAVSYCAEYGKSPPCFLQSRVGTW